MKVLGMINKTRQTTHIHLYLHPKWIKSESEVTGNKSKTRNSLQYFGIKKTSKKMSFINFYYYLHIIKKIPGK